MEITKPYNVLWTNEPTLDNCEIICLADIHTQDLEIKIPGHADIINSISRQGEDFLLMEGVVTERSSKNVEKFFTDRKSITIVGWDHQTIMTRFTAIHLILNCITEVVASRFENLLSPEGCNQLLKELPTLVLLDQALAKIDDEALKTEISQHFEPELNKIIEQLSTNVSEISQSAQRMHQKLSYPNCGKDLNAFVRNGLNTIIDSTNKYFFRYSFPIYSSLVHTTKDNFDTCIVSIRGSLEFDRSLDMALIPHIMNWLIEQKDLILKIILDHPGSVEEITYDRKELNDLLSTPIINRFLQETFEARTQSMIETVNRIKNLIGTNQQKIFIIAGASHFNYNHQFHQMHTSRHFLNPFYQCLHGKKVAILCRNPNPFFCGDEVQRCGGKLSLDIPSNP